MLNFAKKVCAILDYFEMFSDRLRVLDSLGSGQTSCNFALVCITLLTVSSFSAKFI